MRISVTTTGEGEAAEAIVRIGRRAVDARPALVRAQQILAQGERAQFILARAARSPQRRNTTARKRRAGFAAVPYRQSGDLEGSLTTASGNDAAVRKIAGDTLRFGTDAYYVGFQKDQLVKVTPQTLSRLDAMVADYLMTGRLP